MKLYTRKTHFAYGIHHPLWRNMVAPTVVRSGGLHPWPDKTQTSSSGERKTPAKSHTPGALSPSSEALCQWKPKQHFKNEEVSCSLLLNLGQPRWEVAGSGAIFNKDELQARGPDSQRVGTAGGPPFSYAPALKQTLEKSCGRLQRGNQRMDSLCSRTQVWCVVSSASLRSAPPCPLPPPPTAPPSPGQGSGGRWQALMCGPRSLLGTPGGGSVGPDCLALSSWQMVSVKLHLIELLGIYGAYIFYGNSWCTNVRFGWWTLFWIGTSFRSLGEEQGVCLYVFDNICK